MSCQSTPKEAMAWVFEKFGLGFPSLIGHKHLEKKNWASHHGYHIKHYIATKAFPGVH